MVSDGECEGVGDEKMNQGCEFCGNVVSTISKDRRTYSVCEPKTFAEPQPRGHSV